MGSQLGGSTHTPTSVWAAVFFVVAGACGLAVGIVVGLMWLSIVGAVVSAGAFAAAMGLGMMSHTEEYPPSGQSAG